jgi:hypothetical protein
MMDVSTILFFYAFGLAIWLMGRAELTRRQRVWVSGPRWVATVYSLVLLPLVLDVSLSALSLPWTIWLDVFVPGLFGLAVLAMIWHAFSRPVYSVHGTTAVSLAAAIREALGVAGPSISESLGSIQIDGWCGRLRLTGTSLSVEDLGDRKRLAKLAREIAGTAAPMALGVSPSGADIARDLRLGWAYQFGLGVVFAVIAAELFFRY